MHVNMLVIAAQIDASANERRQNAVQSALMVIAANVKPANHVRIFCSFFFSLLQNTAFFCVRNIR